MLTMPQRKRRIAENSGSGESSTKRGNAVSLEGAAPVDSEYSGHTSVHVFSEYGDVYDVMLNQTNVGNNNNKFYIIQLLEANSSKRYFVWNRWGRVGFRGQSAIIEYGSDLEAAKKAFCGKFLDKTKNDWCDRKKFTKVPGKYDLVKIDYTLKASAKDERAAAPVKLPESKLDKRLQALIKLICDVKQMEDVVKQMKYDTQKAPLGRLTVEQIKAGYAALKTIDSCIDRKDFGRSLIDACNDFYTRIPHCFGMSQPPVIRSKTEVKDKLDLLEALGDIEIAMRILQDRSSTENPLDVQYKSLNCDVKCVDSSTEVFKMIEDYLSNTHAPTHKQYKMKVLDVFEVNRRGETEDFIDVGNRRLLWHGSRLTNMIGIISQGLRIAPPEAPSTGYMFGKGIYFADVSSKSANYCFATRTQTVGLLLLCEVSLGNGRELLSADYDAHKLPKGHHSVKGLGRLAPDPAENVIWSDGTIIPLGHLVDTGAGNSDGYSLNYNEYIVYDVRQVKMKYVVQVQFSFD